MRRLIRLAQVTLLMLVAGYATLLLVVAIVQPKPVDTPQETRSSETASQLQAEATFLSPGSR